MNIRLATPNDVVALAPLMAAFNAGEGIRWEAHAVGEAFKRLCEAPSLGFVLIAEDPRTPRPNGYIVVTYNYDLEFAGRDAFVTELYVTSEVRRQGVGVTLLGAAETEARRHDVRALHLLVTPGNQVAEALYRRAGFVASPRIMMTKTMPVDP